MSYWFDSIHIEAENSYNIQTELESYIESGGNLFIELAENLIEKPDFDFKIIQLESLRFFLDKSSKLSKDFCPYNLSAIQLAFSKMLPKTSVNSVSVSLSILLSIYLVNMYIIVIIFYD